MRRSIHPRSKILIWIWRCHLTMFFCTLLVNKGVRVFIEECSYKYSSINTFFPRIPHDFFTEIQIFKYSNGYNNGYFFPSDFRQKQIFTDFRPFFRWITNDSSVRRKISTDFRQFCSREKSIWNPSKFDLNLPTSKYPWKMSWEIALFSCNVILLNEILDHKTLNKIKNLYQNYHSTYS